MTDIPSISDLAKAAEIAKRLMISEEGWYDEHAPNTPVEARNSVMRDAADLILSLTSRVEMLEEALKLAEKADDQHINCQDCEGQEEPALCGTCCPLADEARLTRWAALGINQPQAAKVLPFNRALSTGDKPLTPESKPPIG